MPNQDTKPTRIEEPVETKQPQIFAPLLRTLMWLVPVIVVIVIVVLALIGPAVGNVFSNIVPAI